MVRAALYRSDDQIYLLTPRNGQPAEFDQWRWERLNRVADLVALFGGKFIGMVARQFAQYRAKRTRRNPRPHCVRSDRDHMAIAVALGAIAERAVDRILFIGGL